LPVKATTEKKRSADAHREGRSATVSLPEKVPVSSLPSRDGESDRVDD
jgi:hypothetical protein